MARRASTKPPPAHPKSVAPASSGFRLAASQTPARHVGGAHRADAEGPRLVADERYFGLEARELRAGLERSLARLSARDAGEQRIDVDILGDSFGLDGSASTALLRAFVVRGLLQPDGQGQYRVTTLFQDYAVARIIAPMSRERAKALLERTRALGMRINLGWTRNLYRIRMIAVSGSYMSRRKHLPELSLWLVLQRRPFVRAPKWRRGMSKADALRDIVEAVRAQSSFITVRVVADKDVVQRPFSLVFQSGDEVIGDSVPTWERFRDWGASISRRLGGK